MSETQDNQTPAEQQPSKLRDILTLIRLPNLFTVVADTLLGLCIAYKSLGSIFLQQSWAFSLLLIPASLCYYAGGVVLNDLFDRKIDQKERPERPLPSGRVSVWFVSLLRWGLLLGGIAITAFVSSRLLEMQPSIFQSPLTFGILLAACVVLYNAILKRTVLGPIAMGACRMLNLLMAVSVSDRIDPIVWILVGGFGIYVAGITWFARDEAATARRSHLIGATVTMVVGLVCLSLLPVVVFYLFMDGWTSISWNEFLLYFIYSLLPFSLVISLTLWRCIRVIRDPQPKRIQSAVGMAILRLIVIDAILIMWLWNNFLWTAAVLALLIPAILTRRFISPT